MSSLRILPVGLLLVTALGVAGSAQADHTGSIHGLVARLHGQATVAEAEIRGGYSRSSHYGELNAAANAVHHQIDELQSHLRMGYAPQQLRRDALQLDQAIRQLDQMVEHVEGDVRSGQTRLVVNPAVLHRRVHEMQALAQQIVSSLPAPTTTFRPNWGGQGFGSNCDNGSFGNYGYGSNFGNYGYGSNFGNGGYQVNPQSGFQFGSGNGGFYFGGRNWGIQLGR